MTIRNCLKFLAWTVFFTVTLGYLALRYLIWPQVPSLKPRIEASLTQQLGKPLTIGSIQTSWDRFMPSLSISQITIGGQSQAMDAVAPALSLANVEATLSWRTLTSLDLKFASIVFRQPQIQIKRLVSGAFEIAGIALLKDDKSDDKSGLRWLLDQRNIQIIDGQLLWQDELAAGAPVIANAVQARLQSRGRSHQLAGQIGQIVDANTQAVLATGIDVRGDFLRPVGSQTIDLARWGGDTYVAFSKLQLPALEVQLKPWLAAEQQHWLDTIKSGRLDARAWLKFSETSLPQMQVNLSADTITALAPNQIPLTQKRLINLSKLQLSTKIERRRSESVV